MSDVLIGIMNKSFDRKEERPTCIEFVLFFLFKNFPL